MKATGLILLFVFVFLPSGTQSVGHYKRDNNQQEEEQVQPFQSGKTYSFLYNAQIASGLDTNGIGQSTDEPQQKAVTRLEAQVKISFRTENQASLQLKSIQVAQLNKGIDSPQQVQPMEEFERKAIDGDKRRQLELPVHFEYNQGLVQQIQFGEEDHTWSQNIKRAILNLIQLNLKGGEQQSEEEGDNGRSRSFTLQEETIEGQCRTTYSITKPQQQQEEDQQVFNVTKSIDFKQCRKIADIAYGFQTQQQQPQCQKCQKQWQQWLSSSNQQQEQGPNPCEECDPKEVKEQTLDRSTVLRFVLQGQQEGQQGIKRVELVSQYIYKTLRAENGQYSAAMQTVVAATLQFKGIQQTQQEQEQLTGNRKKVSLVYDNQWDSEEKLFYMNGDQETPSPFSHVPRKPDQAQQIIRRLVNAAQDKSEGIEFEQLAQFQKLVEVFRMCTVEELKQIHTTAIQQGGDRSKVEQLLADCLAIAGTHNTITFLAERIQRGEIKPIQAAHSLKSVSGLVAPSDKQADIILGLCKNIQGSQTLKQTCWLTFGSIVGELCQHRINTQEQGQQSYVYGSQTGFKGVGVCTQDNKSRYQKALFDQFQQSKSTYEKVLALKAIGNAGIDQSVPELERIITGRGEDRLVRIQAIDALRRQRTQQPRRIQRILLPIFQNTREHPEVRMAAFAMLMHTLPEEHIVDQISYTLVKEGNAQVQSFVYTTMKTLAKSKVPAEQQLAKHLKSTLKLANVDEQSLEVSQKHQLPIYSNEQKEGLFLNLVSVFNHRDILPSHLSLSMDSLLNDQYQLNTLKLGFTQRGMQQWYEKVVSNVLKMFNQQQRSTRAQRSSENMGRQDMENTFRGVSYKSRRPNRDTKNEPFAMICLRVGDVDQVILPIDSQTTPEYFGQFLNGDRPSMSQWMDRMGEQHFRLFTAMNFNEKSAKIATSIGLPLRIVRAIPLLMAVEGSAKVRRGELELNIHPSVCIAHIQKMESWTPIIASGVESIQALELNTPIQAQVQWEQGLKLTIEVPQQKTRVLGVHTLPVTYTQEWDSKTKQLREPRVKAIHIPQLEQLQCEVDKKVGEHTLGLPLHFHGHYHCPSMDYKQSLQLALATENHVHFTFRPIEGTPKQIVLRLGGSIFQSNGNTNRGPQLDNFYSNSNKFEQAHPEDDFEDMNLEKHEQKKQKLNTLLQGSQGKIYEHSVKLEAHTQGGRKEAKAQLELKAGCDEKLKSCRVQLEVQRTPLLMNEQSQWTLSSKIEFLMPDAVSNVQQLEQGRKHQRFILQSQNEWGCAEKKQSINFRLQGEQGQNEQHRRQLSRYEEGPERTYNQKQMAFLNKFDFQADYKLQSAAQSRWNSYFEVVKVRNYRNTQSQLEEGNNAKQGRVSGTIVIDPIGQRHANVSIQTSSQRVKIQSMELPTPIRPFSLVRAGDKSTHSPSQLFKRMANGRGRAECSVDGRRVKTFDQEQYNSPIGKCYTVLAKDCSNDQNDAQFAVMIKTIGNGKDKKVKVITPEQTITCKPISSSSSSSESNESKRLQCKVNGREVSVQSSGDSQLVEYNNDEQTDVTINVEGVQVRMGCNCGGCKCQKVWIKISQQYKDQQCGLCGHYDEQSGNELRMNDDEETQDFARFHRSYTLQDNEDQCSEQENNDFYSQKDRFQQDSSNNNIQGDYQQQEEEDQWAAGAYETNNHDDQWRPSKRSTKGMKIWQIKKEQKKQKKQQQQQAQQQLEQGQDSQQQGRQNKQVQRQWSGEDQQQGNQQQWSGEQGQRQGNQYTQEPVEQTKVIEYSHRVCFSVEPVKQCPQGTTPQSNDDDDYQQDQQAKKVKFSCVDRSDPNARRFLQKARRGEIVKLEDESPSFVQRVQQPAQCSVY